MQSLSNKIRAQALKNALEHDSAVVGKVLPKLFQHGLKKEDIKKIMPELNKIINEINSLSKKEKEEQFKQYEKYIPEKKEKSDELPELPNVKKKMVFRLAPYPSGALHIGNAKTYLLNAMYAEKYNGKIILMMDDTIGSEEKQLTKESYKLIEEAFDWLGVKYKKPIYYKSDRLDIYYDYAIKLIEKNKAYVCHCSQSDFKELKDNKKDCPCRNKSVEEELKAWKEMFKAKPGEAALRIKTSMQDPNPAFRDRVLFRISERKHPRVGNKYRVWPTLEITWAIDDHLLGVTHIIRGEELRMETEMEKYIWDIFSWSHAEAIHTGLFSLEGVGAKISKSKAQKEVLSGAYSGWDDPRTWSIQSLKRRGIKSEAIRAFVKSIGLNKQNIIAPIESLYAINRKLIDASSNRYSFTPNPIEIKIEKQPKLKSVKVPTHPDKKTTRAIKVNKIYISESDFQKFKGSEIRLLHLFNIALDKSQHKALFTSIENKNIPKINWVSDSEKVKVLMPNSDSMEGIAESSIKKLKLGEVIQFERFGFVKLDKKSDPYEFWFAHK